MIVRERLDFERGIDPKISMDIGNKWVRIKSGDIIECIKRTIIREKDDQDFITFEEYFDEIYFGDRDYTFDVGNVAVIKSVEGDEKNLSIKMVGFMTKEEALESRNLALYPVTKGSAPIETWAQFFKVINR
jgi:hypothetical protein